MKGTIVKAIIKAAITIALVLLVIVAVAGCKGGATTSGKASKSAPSKTVVQQPEQDNAAGNAVSKEKTAQALPPKKTIPITLYFGDTQGEHLLPEIRQIPETSTVAKIAIEELIKGPSLKESTHVKTIPPEAKVLNVDIIKGVAYVNFSQELITKHWGGSSGEQMTIGSIVDTLTEFKNIQKVQIMVNGKAVDTIAGHLDTSQPLTRDESLIKK